MHQNVRRAPDSRQRREHFQFFPPAPQLQIKFVTGERRVLLVVQPVRPLPAAAGAVRVPGLRPGRAAQHQPQFVRAHSRVGARPLQRQLARRHGHRLARTYHDCICGVKLNSNENYASFFKI